MSRGDSSDAPNRRIASHQRQISGGGAFQAPQPGSGQSSIVVSLLGCGIGHRGCSCPAARRGCHAPCRPAIDRPRPRDHAAAYHQQMPASAYALLGVFILLSIAVGIAAAWVVGPRRAAAAIMPVLAAFGALYWVGHRSGLQLGPTIDLLRLLGRHRPGRPRRRGCGGRRGARPASSPGPSADPAGHQPAPGA